MVDTTPDSELLERVRDGDRPALEVLLARYQGALLRYANTMCRQRQDAEGVVQETLIAAARTLPDFRGDAQVSTWLYQIARRFCLKRRRRRAGEPDQLESLHEIPLAESGGRAAGPSPEEAVAGNELHRVLELAIAGLDPQYRDVLVLRDVEGFKASEVAEIVGLTIPGVKSRLHRARRQVRDALRIYLPDPPTTRPGCPDVVEMYSKHVEGDLSAEVCTSMEHHLETCPACTAACGSLRHSLSVCSSVPTVQVPDHVQDAVRKSLRDLFSAS